MTPKKKNKKDLEDIDFMQEINAAGVRDASRFAYLLSVGVLLFLVVFIVWSNWAILDEVTKGQGQVIPSSRVQTIQNLEGGILSEILVEVGTIVEPGDVLLRIDNSMAKSTYNEEQTRYNNLRARIIRLESEVSDKALKFPDELKKEAPNAVSFEETQYSINKQRLQAESSVLSSRAQQRRQEVEEMQSRQRQLEDQLAVAQQELNMTRPLVQQGVMPQLDLIRIQGQVTDLQGEIRTVKLSIPRAQNAVNEANQQIRELKLNAKAEASRELNEIRAEFESLAQSMVAGEDRFKRTEVTSKIKGTVKEIFINSVGGVIQPGEEIMQIVPLDDTLLIEAKITPADIAFISPGQKAVVKITAYDFSIYGGLEGIVEQISADTIVDEEGDSFYKVYLRTEETVLKHKGKELPIIPGMTASVDILTGQKSVFAYLMKPILKAKNEALRER